MTLIAPLQSIVDTMNKRVCPLYSFDDGGRIHLVGSAVPFTNSEGAFLVTAAHVCFTSRKQPLPLFTWSEIGPLMLNQFRIAWDYQPGITPDADVALMELSNKDAAVLKQSFQFSDPSVVATTKPKTLGVHYLICGYPSVRNRITSRSLSPPALATSLVTGHIQSIQEIKAADKSEEHHFALAFPSKEIRTIRGEVFRVPKPQGMSGGGIWRLDIDAQTYMARTPMLVGIGIEYHKTSRVFVGTKIQLALSLAPDLYASTVRHSDEN